MRGRWIGNGGRYVSGDRPERVVMLGMVGSPALWPAFLGWMDMGLVDDLRDAIQGKSGHIEIVVDGVEIRGDVYTSHGRERMAVSAEMVAVIRHGLRKRGRAERRRERWKVHGNT